MITVADDPAQSLTLYNTSYEDDYFVRVSKHFETLCRVRLEEWRRCRIHDVKQIMIMMESYGACTLQDEKESGMRGIS